MKSQLYELIQKSNNGTYRIKIETPTYDYKDRFIRDTNTHNIICSATVKIENKNMSFDSGVFTNKKDANQDVCKKIFEYIEKHNNSVNSSDNTNNTNNNTNKIRTDILKPLTKSNKNRSSNIRQDCSPYNNEDVVIDKNLLILIDYENVSNANQLQKLDTFLKNIIFVGEEDNMDNMDNTDKCINIIKFAGCASSMKDNADIVVKSTRKDAVDHYIGFYLGQMIGKDPKLVETHSIHILSRDKFASCLEDFCEAITHNVDVDDLIESVIRLATK
jgi:hypothetical protein